eukprot:1524176-Rhodomonas_salina.4
MARSHLLTRQLVPRILGAIPGPNCTEGVFVFAFDSPSFLDAVDSAQQVVIWKSSRCLVKSSTWYQKTQRTINRKKKRKSRTLSTRNTLSGEDQYHGGDRTTGERVCQPTVRKMIASVPKSAQLWARYRFHLVRPYAPVSTVHRVADSIQRSSR